VTLCLKTDLRHYNQPEEQNTNNVVTLCQMNKKIMRVANNAQRKQRHDAMSNEQKEKCE
jgi:hypothetical protein